VRIELEIVVRLEGHRANELRNDERKAFREMRKGRAQELRALRARDVAWRHVGSTRNEVRSEAQAVAADLPLDEKHCDSPLLPQNQRLRGVCQMLASLVR
jgi:hypothetical protein